MMRLLKPLYRIADFSKLTYKQLATPELIKKILKKPVEGHQRMTQLHFYQGKRDGTGQQSCFSEKKSIRRFSVNVFPKKIRSHILDRTIKTKFSSKAYKTMKRYGGLDNYILCGTKQQVDSNYGEYLRKLMQEKIKNPDMIIPYIVRTRPYVRTQSRMYKFAKVAKLVIPKNLRRYWTPNRPFGVDMDELTQEDYDKELELRKIQTSYQDVQTSHPLLIELKKKQDAKRDPVFEAQAAEVKRKFYDHPRYKRLKKLTFEEDEKEMAEEIAKIAENQFKNPDGSDLQ